LILVLVLLAGFGCGEAPDSSRELQTAGSLGSPAPRPETEDLTLARALVGRGGTLDQALQRFEIEDGLRNRIIAVLGPHVELRRLSPDTGVALARNDAGTPVYLTCRASMESYVRVDIHPDGTLETNPVEVPVRTIVETAGGVVESTVAEALTPYQDAIRLTHAFADIFQWDVDLFVDPRPGDEIRIVYETRRLGRTPSDLPPFGASETVEGEYLGLGRILAASYEGEQARSIAYWVADDGNGGGYYDNEGDSLAKAFLKSPLNYRRISSRFSRARRHPITRKVSPHHGVDFVADRGTPVVAAADGRVESAGWQGNLGKAVRIRHGRGYTTVYGHLGGFSKGVRSGARVAQNQVIGYVGSTGRATGPHLHYTLLANGRPVDPLTFDNPPTEPLQASMMPMLEEARRNWSPVLYSIPFEAPRAGLAWVLPDEHCTPSS
jgi:murein DD-endopeptidase MepM/ murein hydrolase activator NlpD